jgi:hypothetical protein
LHNYVDTGIRTNRSIKLHNFNTKWPTIYFSLLTLAGKRQQYMWVVSVTWQELNINGWNVKITYRDDIYLIIYNTQYDSIHSFWNLWIIFVQTGSIQNHNIWLKSINGPYSHFWHKSCQRKPYNSPCNINSTLGLHCCTHSSNVLMNVLWIMVN